MNNNTPKITILMPVYNGEKYLKKSIESILNQTFKDFEFLIINDSSTDNSEKIIKSYADPRIIFIQNEKNIGVTKTLNRGLELATGEYIARMDADDISLTKRLNKQIKFLEANPKIGICGTWIKTIGNIKGYIQKYPTNPNEAKAQMLFYTPLAHPTVMMRKNILKRFNLKYDENLRNGQDYDLWSRALKYTKISNLNKVLLLYRIHEKSESTKHSNFQKKSAETIRARELKNLNIVPTEKEMTIHQHLRASNDCSILEFLTEKETWLQKLISQNKQTKYHQEPYFSNIIFKQWIMSCYSNINHFATWKIFWKSDLSKKIPPQEWRQIFKFFVKCLLNKG